MHRSSVNSAFGLKKLLSSSCSATMISYKGGKIVAFDNNMSEGLFGTFSMRMRRNGCLGAPGQKSDPPFAPATSISY